MLKIKFRNYLFLVLFLSSALLFFGRVTAAQEKEAAPQPQAEAQISPSVQQQEEQVVIADNLVPSDNVTLDFKDADIRNVLKIISYKVGVNIVATPEVIGNITIRLVDVPWEKALDTIVKTYGFGSEWLSNKIIMVSTLEKLAQQRKARQEAQEMEPLNTEAFVLNFSKVEDIKNAIEKLISAKGKVSLEGRTNTLIVTDAKTNLKSIGEIIKGLDKITPQVMIEAKIIETTLGTADKLGIDWTLQVALSGSARPTTFPFQAGEEYKGSFKKMLPKVEVPSSIERTTETTVGLGGATTAKTTETMFHNLINAFPDISTSAFQFGTLDFSQVKAVLEILNSRSKTKILSNPRITTLNNQQAEILVGTIVPIPNYEYSKDTGTRVVSGYTDQQIGVGLTVTPNINEMDYITLNIKPTIDEITGWTGPNNERPIISTRNAETQVMVKDRQTLVIGGLISEKKIKSKKKVPILGDIPVLGYLFTKREDTVEKTELLIFITPYIIKDGMTPPEEIAKLEERLDRGPEKPKAVEKKKKE